MRLTQTKEIFGDEIDSYKTLVFAIAYDIVNVGKYRKWSADKWNTRKFIKRYPQHIFSYSAAIMVSKTTGRPLDDAFFYIAYTVDAIIGTMPRTFFVDYSTMSKRHDLLPTEYDRITDYPYYAEAFATLDKHGRRYVYGHLYLPPYHYGAKRRYRPDEQRLCIDLLDMMASHFRHRIKNIYHETI